MSKENPEVTLDGATYRLYVLQRELKYHESIYQATIAGFDDCFEFLSASEPEDDDEQDRSHVAVWSRRMQHAATAIAEVSAQVAHAAQTVSELTGGAPKGEPLI